MKIHQRPAFIRALEKLSEAEQELVRRRARKSSAFLIYIQESGCAPSAGIASSGSD